MNRIVGQFIKAFEVAKRKNWDKIYVAVDLHDTTFLPTYSTDLSTEYFPFAREVLKLLSDDENVCLILWSSSLPDSNKEYHRRFKEHNIHFDFINSNPECENSQFADFKTKLYFNVILDDKAAFLPEKDWHEIHKYFLNRRNEKKI